VSLEFAKEKAVNLQSAVLFAIVLATASLACAQSVSADLHVLPVQGNVYMLVGAGGNITVQVGKDGALLVDAGLASYSDKIFAEIRKLAGKPLRYIIDTHLDMDHVGGNEALAKRGNTVAGGNVVNDIGESAVDAATVISHENVMTRLAAKPEGNRQTVSFGMLPTDTYSGGEKEVFFNGEAVQMLHVPSANTDGDSIVFFRRSDVISTGDIFVTDGYPVIDLAHGGSVQGVVNGLNLVLDLTIPAEKQEGGTMVIPGHGRLCDEADVVEYRDMMTIIRDRVQSMIAKGMTLEQVKQSRPTLDYDPRYGSAKGPWTTDMFVEAVYRSLRK
jgi:cyclase